MLDPRLRSFLAVCAAGSFSRAAEVVHLTQPALSRHVKELEQRLGAKLFEYSRRTLHITEAGELLRRYASRAEADGQRTAALIREGAGRFPLRIGATRTIGEYVLPRHMAAYLRQQPDADLSLRVDNTDALLPALRAGEIDFAFIEGVFDREDYDTELFLRAAFFPVCGQADPLATGGPHPLSELLARRLIVREKGSGSRLLLERTLEASNRYLSHFSSVLELGNLEAIKDLVAEGLGLAFLYEQSVEKELSAGRLCRIALEGFPVIHDYSFVTLKDSLYAERYLEFLRFCRGEA